MSDLDQRPVKDEWKIVTDPDDPNLMRMFLNGQEFDVQAFGLGRCINGKTVMKLEVLIDINQLSILNDVSQCGSESENLMTFKNLDLTGFPLKQQ
jgi:hypothetical protein